MPLLLFVFCLCIAVLIPSAAFAAEGYALHIQDVLQAIIGAVFSILGVVATAAIGVMAHRIDKKTGIEIDDNTRQYLNNALQNGLKYAENKARSAAENIEDPVIKNKVVADAANYVTQNVPDALAHFGVTPDQLGDLLVARLTQEKGAANEPISPVKNSGAAEAGI